MFRHFYFESDARSAKTRDRSIGPLTRWLLQQRACSRPAASPRGAGFPGFIFLNRKTERSRSHILTAILLFFDVHFSTCTCRGYRDEKFALRRGNAARKLGARKYVPVRGKVQKEEEFEFRSNTKKVPERRPRV